MRRNRYLELINAEPPKPSNPTDTPNPGETSNPTKTANPSKTSNPPNTSQPTNPSETTNTPNTSKPSYPGEETKPSKPPKTSYTSKTGNRGKRANPGEIAPTRDFTRVANSILRDAVSAGVFTGKSKQLYDVLYARTRGAIVPKMSAQVPRAVLMGAADISSTITLKKNLLLLRESGLITWEERAGVRGGNEYTVYLPEEVEPSNPGKPGNTSQRLEGLPGSGTNQTNQGLDLTVSTGYGPPNTLSNTNTIIDDEGYATLIASISRVTGIPEDEITMLETLSVLETVFAKAASRTNTVSNPDKFLAAVLRRAFAKPQRKTETPRVEQGREVPDTEKTDPLELYQDLLRSGYTLEQLRDQFSGAHSSDDWKEIEEKLTDD